MEEYYSLEIKEALESLQSSQKGLSSDEVEKRQNQFGTNELKKEKKHSALKIFIGQFKNAITLILIAAGVISLFLGDLIESIAMFSIVLINALLGFFQEYKAEKALDALESLSAPNARVIRNGVEEKILAKELVPGDIILFESGDIVAADSRLIEVSSLQIDEAPLTGESSPSRKVITPFDKGTSVADQENMAFSGTIVTYGKGKGIVTGIGMGTEFGKIAESIQGSPETKTPLQIKFEELAKQISIVAISLILIIVILGNLSGAASLSGMLLIALTLAVATIPVALPTIVTVSLAFGSKHLSKKNMLIKKLPAAESLGAVTVICTDKTGTITKNQMTVTDIYFQNQLIKVSGIGYEPEGMFSTDEGQINPKNLELFFRTGMLCNNSKVSKKNSKFEIIGDPTEGSLLVLGRKGQVNEESLKGSFAFVEELPFDSDRKLMSVIYKNRESEKLEAYSKGAPDMLLKACNRIYLDGKAVILSEEDREKILKSNEEFAENALRVLGFAYKELQDSSDRSQPSVESELVFLGLVGMIDPPREEVAHAISQCSEAGIKVIMITGDHPTTAKAIAKKIGLLENEDLVLSGEDLDKLSESELQEKIDRVRIIARALPIQKSRIVDALKEKGHIVAMTGDGVNDAPALKKADIGIAMGITGTDVAKEVSKAVLTDDNFATIVNAIKEGRNIFDKMIKSAKYLLACNAGEIATIFIAIMVRLPIPLIPLQILLINLLTDALPALGLGLEEPEDGIMKRKPRHPKEKPISGRIFATIVIFGLIMGLGTLYVFTKHKDTDLIRAQTAAFTTLVLFQLFAVLSSRSLTFSLKKLNPFSNLWLLGAVMLSVAIQFAVVYYPPLQPIFGTVALGMDDWIQILIISSFGFIIMVISNFFISVPLKNTQRQN
ncbi:MAG TPA: cation-translocating P-type ATPase [Candidatus Nanoarchaeia archaeon]|nr:cation-translocating P-type ATPase [Candidatus Nanoarchaeia archaeon]